MKTLILGTALAICSINASAQNTNVTDVSRTTVTTVKDSDGEKKMVKDQNIQSVQNIELQDADSKELNKNVRDTDAQVTSTTRVTAPDGTVRMVDVDRSGNYSFGGNDYRVSLDNVGYVVTGNNGKKEAVIRELSKNNYLVKSKNRTSVGSYDDKGNLVLKSYDDKTDKIIVEIYTKK